MLRSPMNSISSKDSSPGLPSRAYVSGLALRRPTVTVVAEDKSKLIGTV
jgi:hypothetical protein